MVSSGNRSSLGYGNSMAGNSMGAGPGAKPPPSNAAGLAGNANAIDSAYKARTGAIDRNTLANLIGRFGGAFNGTPGPGAPITGDPATQAAQAQLAANPAPPAEVPVAPAPVAPAPVVPAAAEAPVLPSGLPSPTAEFPVIPTAAIAPTPTMPPPAAIPAGPAPAAPAPLPQQQGMSRQEFNKMAAQREQQQKRDQYMQSRLGGHR